MNSLVTTARTYYSADKNSAMEIRRKTSALFSRTLNSGRRNMLWKKLFGKQNHLTALSKVKSDARQTATQGKAIINVPLENIVGSESRARDFDKQFRPLVSHLRDRWVGIAIAYRQGKSFPPVELIRFGDEYYVRDGHHRISIAKLFGQATIEAEIVSQFV